MRKSTHTFDYRLLLQRLVAIRKEAGLSQRKLAEFLRVPHSWVAKVESGERRLDLIEFGWFCAACGAFPADEMEKIFNGRRPAQQSPSRKGVRK